MHCPNCNEEITTVNAELEDSSADVTGATDVSISVSFTLFCVSCDYELGEYEFNNDQDIGDFIDEHEDHEFGVDLLHESFAILKSNGRTSVGAEATLRVVCEQCSTNTDYEWSEYESLDDVLDELV